MNRLEELFADRVEFYHLNFDRGEVVDLLRAYDVRRRSTYVLLAPDGEIARTWTGPLSEERIAADIEEQLALFGQ